MDFEEFMEAYRKAAKASSLPDIVVTDRPEEARVLGFDVQPLPEGFDVSQCFERYLQLNKPEYEDRCVMRGPKE